jgi:hypothetical protein
VSGNNIGANFERKSGDGWTGAEYVVPGATKSSIVVPSSMAAAVPVGDSEAVDAMMISQRKRKLPHAPVQEPCVTITEIIK